MLNRHSIRMFNQLYYHRATGSGHRRRVHLEPYFFPLDSILHWNRIYGRRGFLQYQLVLPRESGEEGLNRILGKISDSGQGSFLAVLKAFGDANRNYLSFPLGGYTLALDFKRDRELDTRPPARRDSAGSRWPDLPHQGRTHARSSVQAQLSPVGAVCQGASSLWRGQAVQFPAIRAAGHLMQTRVIFGANSAIAIATARLWAGRGDRLYLLARNPQRLSRLAADLEIRGAGEVSTAAFEATDRASHGALVSEVFTRLGQVDTVLVAHGSLPDQPACERDIALAGEQIDINASGTVSLLGHVANHLQAQGRGCIAVITSVAGERGRQSNYVYGAAKAMVSTFLQGLRNRLYPAGVQVLDIRPGFVDSPMTAGFDKGPLWTQPESIAAVIVRGVDRGRSVTYAPWYWRYIMWVIRCLPEALFKRLRL